MRRVAAFVALASMLGMLACSDLPTNPGPLVEPEVEVDQSTVDAPESVAVGGVTWFLSSLPPHWVYYWSGGAAERVTVSRLTEPAGVVWELVDVSGRGICANARWVNGSCPGGMLMHGQVPVGAEATVEVDPLLSLTPDPPAVRYHLVITLMDGRKGGFEFTTYRPCYPEEAPPPNYSCG